jgi:ABC-type branched-subunit amino acid transport system ATPase component/branched-subunit amino acid ABC-type transport system permease component
MAQILIFVVVGLAAGSVYALAGVGVVVTYRTTGVLNIGTGAIATVAAYLFYTLSVSHGVAWPIAAVLVILVLGTALGLILEPFGRRVRAAPLTFQVAGTVGILLVIEAAITLVYGLTQVRIVPNFVQGSTTIAGALVDWSNIVTFIVVVVLTFLIWLWLRVTRAGIATRGVVENDQLVAISGTNPNRVRRMAWVLGSILACASGVLFAPLLPLDPVQLTLLVVSAFGAAAVGRFTSLPLTCAGGLIIGVLASLATRYITSNALSGIAPSLPFIVLFVVILVLPRSSLRQLVHERRAVPRPTWTAPGRWQALSLTGAVAFLAIVPIFAGLQLTSWTIGLGYIVLFLSLALLVRTSGQVSLCQVTFVAIGAVSLSHLTTGLHLPWFLALLVVGLIAMPIGAVLAIPAMRLPGLFLALATFGFAILVQYMFYPDNFMFGSSGSGLPMPRPVILFTNGQASDTQYYYVCLVLVVIAAGATVILTRSRLGRLLRGVADAPTSLASAGTSVNTTRVIVFCISAFLAAIAGGMIGAAQGTVGQDSFPPILSLTYFAVIIVVVGREPWDALLAAIPLAIIPAYFTSFSVSEYLQLVFGATAILVALSHRAGFGVPKIVTKWIDRVFGSQVRQRRRADVQPASAPPDWARKGGLEALDVVVRFGGVVAVDHVSIKAPTGQITGLIGPNGAGKTTLFNALSGLVRMQNGRAFLYGKDISHSPLSARARRGIGRSFQQMELFESMSVEQNVALGREGAYAGSNPVAHIWGGRSQARAIRVATERALELCDLSLLATTPVSALSTGQRRLVDLARCFAGDFSVLLLDEPSSGLNDVETAKVGQILRRAVAERGMSILLVEHDLSLVLDLCRNIYVLDFGRPIFEGPPAEIRTSSIVQSVYLGSTVLEDQSQGEAL